MSHLNSKQAMQSMSHAIVGGLSYKSTGSGTAIAGVVDPNGPARVVCVKVHFTSAATTPEELTITSEDLDKGSQHNFVYFTQNVSGLTDIVFTDPIFLDQTERLKVSFANSDALVWGLTVLYGE